MKLTSIPILLFVLVCPIKMIAQKVTNLWNVERTLTVAGFGKYQEIKIDEAAVSKLYYSKIAVLEIGVNDKNNRLLLVELVEIPMNTVLVKLNNKDYASNIQLPKLYRGKVKGLSAVNNIMLTISPSYLSMQAYLPDETITIEPDRRNNTKAFVLQHSGDITYKAKAWDCGLADTEPMVKPASTSVNKNTAPVAAIDKCTFVFIDCSNRLFRNQNSNVQTMVNYVYSIWNDVKTAYNKEQMNVLISEINIWTTADPFVVSSTTLVANRSFADYYKDNYWGNMALLLDFANTGGGIAGGYGWAKSTAPNTCGNYNAAPMPSWNFGSFAFCDLSGNGTTSNFPTSNITWQVLVTIHELGHLFSSWHTQSCLWPGGPIDNCVTKEGSCTQNGAAPSNGGTFMSYCHLSSVGVNFNNGFGTLPGDTIRRFVVNNSCIANCTSCVLNDVIGNFNITDFQQKEVTNQIIANGIITTPNGFFKLDAGNRVILQTGFKVTAGNKVHIIIDGCGGIR